MNPIVVASVQFESKRADPQTNLERALQYSFEAATKGARIIVLPELCMTGPDLTPRDAIACSQVAEGYQTNAFVPLARRYGALIVFGYAELCDGQLYNSVAMVGPNGLYGNARKKCLEGRDFIWASPGDDSIAPIVIHEGIRVGVLVSHDVRNKKRDSYAWKQESPFYKKGMVELVCVPCAWQEGFSFPDSKWVGLAEELKSAVAVSNLIFEDRHGRTGGGSCIVDKCLKVWTYGSSLTAPAVVGGLVET
jgi:predicted amidohydrolase